MSILTPFFNLFKPSKADGVKVSDFNANMDIIDTEMHRPPLTVNGVLPNETTRDIYLESVPLADNLSSGDAQFDVGTFLVRTSGGDASIADGAASLSTIKGSMVKTGYVAEVIDMTVNAVPRVAPPAITATLDAETFEAYVEEAGTYTLSYTTEWSANPALYGVTVSNTPVSGDEIVIYWDGENEPEMDVNAVERPVPAAITATINNATFRAYVSQSGTVTLSYTTAWSANPALYGITVSNTPVSGDSIVVEYVKENRGTITTANVSVFNSTGWNLFQTAQSYARVVRYSDTYGYKIGGSYSLVNFATTPTGTSTAVNVDANGYFNVPEDGYVIVTGADATTYIYATWSDWTEGYEGEFQEYTVDSIDLSEIMVNFVAGLCAIGDVRDEINFNTQKAISRIQRMEYTDANLAAVIASGRPYDTDTNYIYVVRATYDETSFSLDPTYTVSDHGLEFYTASTSVPPVTETIYGNNLKDKLRTDVLTISQQTLSPSQQAQVLENIGALSENDIGTFSSVSSLEDALNAQLAIMDALTFRVLKCRFTSDVSPFMTSRYTIRLMKGSANGYAYAEFVNISGNMFNVVGYRNVAWHYDSYALNTKIPTSNAFDEILIPAGSDLNNYRTPGTFIVPNDSTASQISNMPYSASGRLIVMNRTTSSYMVQEYYPTSSAPTKMVRNYNNGTWTSWDRVALSNKNTYSITLSSGWSASTCEVVNIGKVCILQVNQLKTTTTSNGWKQVGTLDANVQPSGRIWGYFACDTTLSAGKAPVAEVRVNTDRTVEVYAPQANEAYWGGFAYFCY